MNIPPLLEKLLLSNEAVFKNATLGIGGMNMVLVPQGKTAVILEVSIEPFHNIIDFGLIPIFEQGWSDIADPFKLFFKRMHYQLQIINDKYQTYINLADGFSFNTNVSEPGGKNINSAVYFTGKREELFIYTDRSLYFNLIYPFKYNEEGPDSTGLIPSIGSPDLQFSPKIQTLPKTTVTFNGNIAEDFVLNVQINNGSPTVDRYYPVSKQTSQDQYPQQEYLRFINVWRENSIFQPVTDDVEYQFVDLLKIPFINVKYALLNKRPDDYGITMPTKS
ncbi:MAG: hypothetical protein EBS07_12680 [Sphingobacteriia bacterium]|nr:hypothetical protein [Sphingobacteriia bacterium]